MSATEDFAVGSAPESTVMAIRNLIVERRLVPGEQIRQEAVGKTLNVSRVPVREALQVLVAEGLVTYSAKRGFFVTKLKASEFLQIRQMRGAIEQGALAELEWPDDDYLVALEGVNDLYCEAGRAGDVTKMLAANRQFHNMILDLSRCKYMVREVRRLQILSDLYRALFVWDRSAHERSIVEHNEMIDALRAHDPSRLVDLRHRHTRVFDREVASSLDED